MPLFHWAMAFKTIVYLINRQSTLVRGLSSPLQKLFQTEPNYLKLKTIGSPCLPWLKPYNSHEFQPKSLPCIFVGYSDSQSTYLLLQLDTNKLYVSRYVTSVEDIFPFQNSPTQPTCSPARHTCLCHVQTMKCH